LVHLVEVSRGFSRVQWSYITYTPKDTARRSHRVVLEMARTMPHSLAKYLLTSEVSIEDSAYRAAFVISWVGEDIDSTVGGTPQVKIIRHEIAQVGYLNEDRVVHASMR